MLGPRSIDSHASSLQHRRSTKLLINRFESLSEDKAAMGTPLRPPKPATSKQDKSPIRQSFRNLFAVLKKGSGLRVGKSKLEDTKSNCSEKPLPATSPSAGDDPFIASVQSLSAPEPTSSLFYLARSPEIRSASPGQCMLWIPCSVILTGEILHITSSSTPSTHSISLKHCTDVRSRTADELDDEEKTLLPGEADRDINVFEVLFEGRAGAKFATNSVRERARWVSAIWDVILPSSGLAGQIEGGKASDTASLPRPSILCLDRALPPVPEPPRSPTVTTPIAVSPIASRLESCASSIYSPSKSTSPSIANLGRLSVVTQRRAQIERNQYSHSTPASPSRLHQTSSVTRTRSLCSQILPQDRVAGRESPTSILDSYGEIYSTQISPSVDPFPDEPEQRHHSNGQDDTSISSTSPDTHDSLLANIYEMISGVARRTEEAENILNIVQNQLSHRTYPELDSTGVTNGLKDVDQRLRSDLPYIMKLLAQIQAGQSDIETKILSKSAEAPCLDKLDQISEQLKEASLQRSVQAHQQTDSVRYLNELNSWLEAFVSGGTAQIQVVAAGVEKLCQQLGCSGEKGGDVLAEIRRLLVDSQANDQTTLLRTSIDNLVTLISSESASFNPLSIAGIIDQQRQEQEGLLRAVAAELTNEIRGERLRFVDAMKEATAINVQMHVEELKKELAHQVRADLFAYYSNQPPTRMAYPTEPSPRTLRMPTGYRAYA
ncbi:hypothetical protein C8R45DRAFT_113260 [Mycena sanguinolenta]|nr:hypothetical protein C8R45DRAFT_113260 [Mycena sanguinolenta]